MLYLEQEPPMTPQQTLASDSPSSPSSSEYGQFGVVGHNEVTGPAHHFGAYVGEAGVGKTSLYREHAGALILNFDLHSTPKPTATASPPLCQVFPVIDAEGRTLGMDKKPIKGGCTWQMFEDLMALLIHAAHADQPRPQTIVIDTLAATLPLKKKRQAEIELKRDNAEWTDIPGGNPTKSAYGRMYDSYVPMVMNLRQAGYGVHILAHIVTSLIPINDDGDTRTVTSHNIPDKIFGRLFPFLEFLGCLEFVNEFEALKDTKGNLVFGKKIPKHYLVNLSDKLASDTRSRVALPERIELPPTNAWQAYEAAYLAACGA